MCSPKSNFVNNKAKLRHNRSLARSVQPVPHIQTDGTAAVFL
jgi:hypothetical protein